MHLKKRLGKMRSFLQPPSPNYFPKQKLLIKRFFNRFDEKQLILNLGSGKKDYRKNVVNLDIQRSSKTNTVSDAHFLPFKAKSFDGIICIAVLEHVKNPFQVIEEMKWILKENGRIFVDIPFMYRYHPSPTDYIRLTKDGIRNLFKDFREIDCGIGGGPASTLSMVLTEFFSSMTSSYTLHTILLTFFGWLFCPIKFLDVFWSKGKYAGVIGMNFYFYGEKK